MWKCFHKYWKNGEIDEGKGKSGPTCEKNSIHLPFDEYRISLRTKLFLNSTFFLFLTFALANRPIISEKFVFFFAPNKPSTFFSLFSPLSFHAPRNFSASFDGAFASFNSRVNFAILVFVELLIQAINDSGKCLHLNWCQPNTNSFGLGQERINLLWSCKLGCNF